MDGDLANVEELRDIAKKYNAILYLDEAHSIGVYGKNGSGCAFGKNYEKEIVVGTFGKSFGSFGSFCIYIRGIYKKNYKFLWWINLHDCITTISLCFNPCST